MRLIHLEKSCRRVQVGLTWRGLAVRTHAVIQGGECVLVQAQICLRFVVTSNILRWLKANGDRPFLQPLALSWNVGVSQSLALFFNGCSCTMLVIQTCSLSSSNVKKGDIVIRSVKARPRSRESSDASLYRSELSARNSDKPLGSWVGQDWS